MADQTRPTSEPRDAGPRHAPPFLGQVVSGVALLVLLGFHMIAQHFVVPTGLRFYDDVIEFLQSPVVIVVEVSFLVVVTYHALVGLRAIIFDFGFSDRTQRLITNIFWVVGIVTLVYGVALFAAILNAA
jgi:succinate dehydrogenase hydrophobic anchor subunit